MDELKELWDDYFHYLIRRGNLGRYLSRYGELFKILHNIEFTWIIDRDDNREADGVDLRDGYTIPSSIAHRCDITTEEAFYAHWCSVFEMLLGLAIRVDDEYLGDPSDERPDIFFMEMIKNLGFAKREKWHDNIVEDVITNWLDRRFGRDGYGSPFPVKHDRRDQRKLEIWDQTISYINEKYFGG